MIQSWKEILPGDRYLIRPNGRLHFIDQQVITCLYQPLIGLAAASLYFTLVQEINLGSDSVSETHHHLMNLMNLSLDRLLTARKKLEAVGLLRSMKKKQHGSVLFLYLLNSPLDPQQFFQHEVFSDFLFHQIGEKDYQRLSKFFTKKSVPAAGFEDVSAAFDEIFQSVPRDDKLSVNRAAQSREKRQADDPLHFNHPFDFNKLANYLSDAIISADALTPEVCKIVEKLAFIYQMDPYDMSRAIEAASLHTGVVDLQTLREEAQEFYRLEHGPEEMPALADRKQPAAEREMDRKEPQNEEEKLIAWYESLSPYQLLEQMSDGGRPVATDLKLVENLLIDMKLNPGVINVLLHYISRVNNHRLNRSFVESVAATWSRAHIRTVRQAMNFARQEKKKFEALKKTTKVRQNSGRTASSVHQEVVPEWMKTDKKAGKQEQAAISQEEAEKRAQWLENYLNSI